MIENIILGLLLLLSLYLLWRHFRKETGGQGECEGCGGCCDGVVKPRPDGGGDGGAEGAVNLRVQRHKQNPPL